MLVRVTDSDPAGLSDTGSKKKKFFLLWEFEMLQVDGNVVKSQRFSLIRFF